MKKINITYRQAIKLFGDDHYNYHKIISINKRYIIYNNIWSLGFKIKDKYGSYVYGGSKYYVPMNNKFGAFEYMENIEFINKKEDRRT